MYIKRFKLSHLSASGIDLGPFHANEVPRLGWSVVEHGEILAIGFFREVEGDLMAVEGPYLKPDSKRGLEAGQLLEKHFMSEAVDRNVDLVRIKVYKP